MNEKLDDWLNRINPGLFTLLKVGEADHLQQLMEGKLRFRSLGFYKALENKDEPFHDDLEGVSSILQANQIQLNIVPTGRPRFILDSTNGLTGQVTFSVKQNAVVFCLYAIHSGPWTDRPITSENKEDFKKYLQPTETIKKFGDSMWTLTKADEFNKRVLDACNRKNLRVNQGLVRYVDKSTFHGSIPDHFIGFVKLEKFSEQREYRYFIESEEPLPDPFVLDVGSLSDVSIITPVEELKIELEPPKELV